MSVSEFVAVVVSLISAITAVVSMIFAFTASARAKRSLRLQMRADARVSEFRDVHLSGGWSMLNGFDDVPATFSVSNSGTTTAYQVVLVLQLPNGRERFLLGDVAPGAAADAIVESLPDDAVSRDIRLHRDLGFSLHWESEHGHPDSAHTPGMQLF